MRSPAPALVVDAAILIAAVRGRSSAIVQAASHTRFLITTDRAVQEARRRIELGLKRPDLLAMIDGLMDMVTIVPAAEFDAELPESRLSLKEAVGSRNGSVKDAHILALAWIADADIWSTDHDFAGTGVATWSTPNLVRGLATSA